MSTEAENVEPRLTFNWTIELKGLPAAYAETVNIPDLETTMVEHSGGGAAYSTKSAGKLKFGNITLEKVMSAERADKWAWNWVRTARDPVTGRGQPKSKYAIDGNLIHYGPGLEIIDKFICTGLWVVKLTYSKMDANQEGEKLIETLELACDKYVRG